MKGRRWLIVLATLSLVLLANSLGITSSPFVDLEDSSGSTFEAWISTLWTQTTQEEFEAGVSNRVDTAESPGEVKLAAVLGVVTDTFDDETKIASKTNLVVTAGQAKLTGGTSESTTLQPGEADSYVMQNDPEKNYGTETLMWVISKEDRQNRRSFVQFDLSSIQNGSTISSATLSLHVKDAPNASRILEAQRLNAAWSELGITWSDQPDVSGGAATAATGTSPDEWLAWDVTSDLRDFIQYQSAANYGWRIKDQSEGSSTDEYKESFYSRDESSETSLRPRLHVDYVSLHDSSGTLASVNLLSGETVGSIDSFDYNASAIPSGTSLKVQFSQDNSNWCDSSGTVDSWDTLSQGAHGIGLSGLGWLGAKFYYSIAFTSDGSDTPVLDEISVDYFAYDTTGTIASPVLDTGIGGAAWDALFWDETLPHSTDTTFEARASDTVFPKDAATPAWTSIGGTSPVTSGLPSGRYLQWRATLTTTDTSKTPTLYEVRVYHS